MIRVHRIPFSTNVERVALAAGVKGIEVEWVDHDPGDRSEIVRPPLYPAAPHARALAGVFVEWFNGVWKGRRTSSTRSLPSRTRIRLRSRA